MIQSELKLYEVIKMLSNTFSPIKIIYNDEVIYNDYDSNIVIETLPDGDKVYGEKEPAEIAITKRHPDKCQDIVTTVNIEIVDYHHSIAILRGVPSKYKPIYVITTFESFPTDDDPWNYGAYRSPGFYYTFEDAEDSVINNCCDIWETCYTYAQITRMEPGMYGYEGENWYYKYDMKSGKYERMNDTEHPCVHICGIG